MIPVMIKTAANLKPSKITMRKRPPLRILLNLHKVKSFQSNNSNSRNLPERILSLILEEQRSIKPQGKRKIVPKMTSKICSKVDEK